MGGFDKEIMNGTRIQIILSGEERDALNKLAERERRDTRQQAEYINRHRARKASAQSESYNFKAICNHYGNQCVACGRSDLSLTVDHIIPLSRGGDDIASNIQPLCQPCNSSKGNHHVTDYRDDQGPPRPKQLSFWRK